MSLPPIGGRLGGGLKRTTTDISVLMAQDVDINSGILYVPQTRRNNARNLKLQANQILDIADYLIKYRPALLKKCYIQSDIFIVSSGAGTSINNIISELIAQLRVNYPYITNIKQTRTSVIVNWLKLFNLRQVQYMCGHRWISSTEAYKMNDIDQLTQDILKYHPF